MAARKINEENGKMSIARGRKVQKVDGEGKGAGHISCYPFGRHFKASARYANDQSADITLKEVAR